MITPLTITSLDQGKIFDRASLEPRDQEEMAPEPVARPSILARMDGLIARGFFMPIATIQTLLVISRS
jgi:hypothetical protein